MSQSGVARVSAGNLPPSVPLQFNGNTGSAVPVANIINFVTSNTTVKFVGSGNTITQDFGITNLFIGSNFTNLTSTENVFVGQGAGLINIFKERCVGIGFEAMKEGSGSDNIAIGYQSLYHVSPNILDPETGITNISIGSNSSFNLTTGDENTIIGNDSHVQSINSEGNCTLGYFTLNSSLGDYNVAIGWTACQAIQGNQNTCVGASTLRNMTGAGNRNIVLGVNSGQNYITTESDNIIINNNGIVSESNVIRIGTQGTGSGQQNQTYIAGVINTVSGRVVKTTIPGAYPYATLITDYAIFVDTTSARTINPIINPVTGTTYRIKDVTGSAGTNNITVTPTGKNIDGSASYVINTNYGSIDIIYSGTEWNVF